ncbi:MAG: hypothetical protein JNM68_11525 [Dinghuibacter sp.]|nr:hypothetical protein [Dinghuibacter sp.]
MGKYSVQLRLLFLLLFMAPVFAGRAGAQQNTRECVRLLNDNSRHQVLSAIKAYALLDTLQVPESVTALEQAARNSSERVRVRVKALGARFLFYWLGPGDSLYAARMKEALSEAYSLNDPFMIAEFSRWYGEMLNTLGNGPLAAQYCMNALKMQQELGFEHFYTPKTFFLTTAEMLFRTMNYNEASAYYAAAFRLPNDSISPKQYTEFKTKLAHAMNGYGRAFYFIKKYDSSVYYLQQCMQYVVQNRLSEDIFYLASDNRFDPYLELGQYDSCRKIADELYAAGLPNDSITLLSACFMRGRIALRSGNYAEALKWSLQSEQYGLHTPKLLYNTYKDIVAAYEALQQKDKAVSYLEKFQELENANSKLKQKASAAFLEAESEFQKSNIRLVQVQEKHRKQVYKRNLLIVVIASLLTLAIVLTVYYNRRRRRSEQALQQAQAQFHFFETRYHSAEEQLAVFKEEVAGLNRKLEQLEAEQYRTTGSSEYVQRVDELSRQIILTENDWDVFRQSFDAVYPGFFTALRIRVPGITPAEIRMACLTRLNFDPKHIAGMLGVSPDTVRKTRYRLKKRFGNEQEKPLEDLIAGI